jgi:type I restriction enzyme R subunit
LTEDQLEQEALGWLADVGSAQVYGPSLAPEGTAPERGSYRDLLLIDRLRSAIRNLNPNIPQAAREDAVAQLLNLGVPNPLSANRQFHRLLVGGVPLEYQKDGETRGDFFRLLDWPHPGLMASRTSAARAAWSGPPSSPRNCMP